MTREMLSVPTSDIVDMPVKFNITRLGGESLEVVVDLTLVKLVCEHYQNKHKLAVEDGSYVTTPDFLVDLAAGLKKYGFIDCSPTIAYEVWCSVSDLISNLKKSIKEQRSSPSGTESTPTSLPENSSTDFTRTSNE